MATIYNVAEPPVNHCNALQSTARKVLSKPSYGIDAPLGLIMSNVLAPLYLYSTLKGKFDVWDKLLEAVPRDTLAEPTLDLGCGRGLVLLKTAQLKRQLAGTASTPLAPAYGVDLFSALAQTGNAPEATYDNAACLGLVDRVVLHTADFTQLPFHDGVFSVVTAGLAVHNVSKARRVQAITEAARVLQPGGHLIVLDLMGFLGGYRTTLESLGWTDVETEFGGIKVMHGSWPSMVLKATKPAASKEGSDDKLDDKFNLG